MMSSSSSNNTNNMIRFPFTATQWQELEHQSLVFKYIISGIPIPPDLLFTIRTSLHSSLSSNFLLHQHTTVGWNGCFQVGFGRKIDPEPGRCRRTDGKKWRCSKEAYPDSKYCERHMHRGRNRSRKPVEIHTTSSTVLSPPPPSVTSPPSAISMSKQKPPSSESHFLHHRFSNSPISINNAFSSHEIPTTNFFLGSNAAYAHAPRDYRDSSVRGMKREKEDGPAYISESNSNSGPINTGKTTTLHDLDSSSDWALTMGSSQIKQKHNTNSTDIFNCLKDNHHHYYKSNNNSSDQAQPMKIIHHFLDEGPPKAHESKDNLWPHYSEDKISAQYRTTTQLSVSTPNSLHDFFITQKWYSLSLLNC